ncbi:MAG: N-formylglutamate amidohydrolase [Citromicrobium sp.]|nr:MAG: N-formylglutamate amidohydrolase [Citromicrobium sp.]
MADDAIDPNLQPAPREFPFEIDQSGNSAFPILIAAPHGGKAYSEELVDNLRNCDALLRLEDRHVDLLAREIRALTGVSTIIATAPRALVDLNRAPDDVDWGMVAGLKLTRPRNSLANRRARNGLGLIPRRLPGQGELWKRPLARAELDRRISAIHAPYHAALSRALMQIRDIWGAALLIDLHSMPPLRKRHSDEVRADFVLGDRFGASCDGRLIAAALRYFGQQDRPIAHNRPYSGGYVLDRHGAPRAGIHAIQLEVCRSTYLDRRFDATSPRLPAVARLLSGLMRTLADETAQIGGSAISQAAE